LPAPEGWWFGGGEMISRIGDDIERRASRLGRPENVFCGSLVL
jgi:hypothetical protein